MHGEATKRSGFAAAGERLRSRVGLPTETGLRPRVGLPTETGLRPLESLVVLLPEGLVEVCVVVVGRLLLTAGQKRFLRFRRKGNDLLSVRVPDRPTPLGDLDLES